MQSDQGRNCQEFRAFGPKRKRTRAVWSYMILSSKEYGQNPDNLLAFIQNKPDVNGGVKSCHWGGAKVGQFGGRALERVALI